ncbi:uncharacterized protein LOC121430329 [Lytechinus variegatus]|uniref:uncharacterized protein LOC121430329 n=1 Tax=Lytechinus variegatus TaxID=7654 RepID=UPI001BB1B5C8|nr:uncharacterized protein LOC121430329 [Lytechinus variegatus]
MADREQTPKSPVKIIGWILPRTISTALCKCLSGIEGMEIWFERFSRAYVVKNEYEKQTGDKMPLEYEGNEDKVREAIKLFGRFIGTDSQLVPERMVYGNVKKDIKRSTSKYIFVKEAYLVFEDKATRPHLPSGFKHVFFIRDPYRLFTSYRKAIYKHLTNVGIRTGDPDDEEAFDIEYDDPIMKPNEFYSGTLEFLKYVRDNLDPYPIVINTNDLLADPAKVLKKFCHLTGLPYSDSLLHWDASPDITKTWKTASDDIMKLSIPFFETAVLSDGFLPLKPTVPVEKMPRDVIRLAKQAMPYYEELNKIKI